ncbi:MAG: PP2C family protein-serine/threonine phosphatase, partial [Bacteroidota bacterium]
SAVFTSGAFASEVKQSSSAAEILTRLNKSVYTHSKRGHFVAFLLAALDVESKTLTFANAGQMKPLLKSNGSVQWLNSVGVNFPLGMKEDSVYGEQTVQLTSGDVLLLLTDGFTEAMNSSKEQFGTERMESFLHRLDADQTSSQKILERVTFEIERHVNGTAQHDDMTMVVVRVL